MNDSPPLLAEQERAEECALCFREIEPGEPRARRGETVFCQLCAQPEREA